jgi:hypothetical protein
LITAVLNRHFGVPAFSALKDFRAMSFAVGKLNSQLFIRSHNETLSVVAM